MLKLVLCSVIFSDVMMSLPNNGAGSNLFFGSVPGTTGQLTTNDEFYTWLNQSLLAVLYKDAQCGNGICESPEEVPGVGRFGWYLLCIYARISRNVFVGSLNLLWKIHV